MSDEQQLREMADTLKRLRRRGKELQARDEVAATPDRIAHHVEHYEYLRDNRQALIEQFFDDDPNAALEVDAWIGEQAQMLLDLFGEKELDDGS